MLLRHALNQRIAQYHRNHGASLHRLLTVKQHTFPQNFPLIWTRATSTVAPLLETDYSTDELRASGEKLANIELRDYQQEALDRVVQKYAEGVTRQLVAMPTGAGKTLFFCCLAKLLDKKTLILTNRHELLQQTKNEWTRVSPDEPLGLMYGKKAELDRQDLHARHLHDVYSWP